MAGCATVELIVTSASMSSPTRAVAGVCSRWTITSSAPPRPTSYVSIWTPRDAASAASDWPAPVVSLPSLTEHDPLLRLVREQRRGQAQRPADVRGALGRHGRDAVDVLQLGRQPLDQRVAPEGDHRGLVVAAPLRERLAQEVEGGTVASGTDAVGQVDDEDGGQAIDRQVQPEAGQGEHERE